MVDWGLVIQGEMIYTNSSGRCRVFRGSYNNQAIVLKRLIFASDSGIKAAENEAKIQLGLIHPHICRLLAFRIESKTKAEILLESMERDLFQEINHRKKMNDYWSETELLQHFEGLVSALEYAQRMGVCHRDIKPQNIFINQGKLYIADFGCAKQTDMNSTSTVQGSPFFFSPELKAAFSKIIRGRFVSIVYNPFKSDVYSLGVTFLFMITLSEMTELTELDHLQQVTDTCIGKLHTGDRVKEMLSDMLTVDANKRLDFEGIQRKYFSKKMAAQVPSASQLGAASSQPILHANVPQPSQLIPATLDSDMSAALQYLHYCFSTETRYTFSVTYTSQCWCCYSVYVVDLLSFYTNEYLYFCSQNCYTKYYFPPQTSTCMICRSEFFSSNEWYPQAQSFPIFSQINVSQICSYPCFDHLRSELESAAQAKPIRKEVQVCSECKGMFYPSSDWHFMIANCSPRLDPEQFCSYDCYELHISHSRRKSQAPSRPSSAMAKRILPMLSLSGQLPSVCSYCGFERKMELVCSGFLREDGKEVKHRFCVNCSRTSKFASGCTVCKGLILKSRKKTS